MLWAVCAVPSRITHSSISVRHTVLMHSAILIIETRTPESCKSSQHGQQSPRRGRKSRVFFSCKQCLTGDSLRYDNPTSLLGGNSPFFWWSAQCGATRCVSAASIQSLLSPIAACWKLHPPTTSVDRIVLWLLSLFGLSNQGKEKSSCYIHAAVPAALCPYVSPSVCLFVCLYAQLRSTSFSSDDRRRRKN